MEKVSAAKYTFSLTFNKEFCFHCGLNFLILNIQEKTSSYSFQISWAKEPLGGCDFFFPALWLHKSISTKGFFFFFVFMFLKEGFIFA